MHVSVALPLDPDRDSGSGLDEAALVRRAREDPAAFEVLYHRYRDRIYWYLRARTQGEEDAADLTQQVFVHALGALHQYHGRKGSVAAWLFGIARHAATDLHRRRRVTIAWDHLPAALHPDDGSDIEADAMRHESLTYLARLLATLPKDRRDLLALRFAGGLTIPEVAAVVGKSADATRKQLTRTLQSLEEHYHDTTE
ncbi:MAG TPA: sigma-70 family RNA polymerase sigma factor [Chloroflexota bacterium]|nr:sigma-70 family RNA polymerase sigma factor [Chloroflexota bacterium]